MAFTKVTDPVDNITNQPVQPVIGAAALQALFDETGKDLKTYLNDVLTVELGATTNGDSGADNVGATALTGGVATTVQGIVEEIDAYAVKKTGNQTIAGVKTFSSSPIVPTATTSTQAINKAQLDAHVIDQIPSDSITNTKLATDVKVGSLLTLSSLLVGFRSSVTVSINKLVDWVGDLTALSTTVKTSLVSAVNELFTNKANKTQEAWVAPTLLNSWVDFDASAYPVVSYYKDEFSNVHIKGFIKNGTTASGTILFVLPVGYRPLKTIYAVCNLAGSTYGSIEIQSGGNVVARSVNTTLTAIINVIYRTDV